MPCSPSPWPSEQPWQRQQLSSGKFSNQQQRHGGQRQPSLPQQHPSQPEHVSPSRPCRQHLRESWRQLMPLRRRQQVPWRQHASWQQQPFVRRRPWPLHGPPSWHEQQQMRQRWPWSYWMMHGQQQPSQKQQIWPQKLTYERPTRQNERQRQRQPWQPCTSWLRVHERDQPW